MDELFVFQQLLSQIEKKTEECQQEKQCKGKKILIQEIEEADNQTDGDNKAHKTGDCLNY